MTDTVLWRSDKEDFIRFVDTTDQVAPELIRYIMKGFDIYSDRVDNLSLRHSYARLISRLLFLAKNHGTSRGDNVTFDIPITQKDLASAINATRENSQQESQYPQETPFGYHEEKIHYYPPC